MSWSSLPEDLWKLILVHVPLPERLGSCSRVSKKLCRAAAAAATEQLTLRLHRFQQRSARLLHWLKNKGHHVTSLDLFEFAGDLRELLCRQLRQLVVDGGRVQLGPSSSHPGVLHSCSGLTKLRLCSCQIVDGPKSLSAVTALQHLELRDAYSIDTYQLSGSTLQVLTRLTFLSLGSVEGSAESLQHISALQHLQVLHLTFPSVALSPSSTPGLAQRTALQNFRLAYFDMHPMDAAVLQPYTGLRQLDLVGGVLTGATNGAVLLSVIGQQLQLQKLVLCELECQWPPAAAAFSALTASSRLQELTVRLEGLPAGIWQAMLGHQQQLPHLQTLAVTSWEREGNEGVVQGPVAFSSTDISRVVACCPALQSLEGRLQPDAQLTALPQLTALTRLSIYKVTESSVRSLSSLLGLRQLVIFGSAPFSVAALLPLTALRQLTRLDGWIPGSASAVQEVQPEHLFLITKAGDSAPDVWLQVQELCASCSSCQPAVV